MLQPVIELYLLWHPGDAALAEPVARELAAHFHGGVYGSLLCGTVEVYRRHVPWAGADDAPRPIPLPGEAPVAGVGPARFVTVVPLVGLALARAVHRAGEPWAAYLERLARARDADPQRVALLPMRLQPEALAGRLARLLGDVQALGEPDPHATLAQPIAQLRRRDLVQALAQWVNPQPGRPLRVFISHTKRQGSPDEPVAELVDAVREVFQAGRVASFYDAHDLQPGRDWNEALRSGAAGSALLALRTDLYASREWCQREMLTAKVHGMPVVVLDALTQGDARGSFLMDHTPRLPLRRSAGGWDRETIGRAIDLLADAWLQRALWHQLKTQSQALPQLGGYWWAPQAPEPSTLARWLRGGPPEGASGDFTGSLGALADRLPGAPLRILHPDPPLAEDEREVLAHLAALAGCGGLDVTTPRLLSARGA